MIPQFKNILSDSINIVQTFLHIGMIQNPFLSTSIVGLTAWYTLKYPWVVDLMKLDGIASISGKYSDFVEGFSCEYIYIYLYSNDQRGQPIGYILANRTYILGTGLIILWGPQKLGHLFAQ